MSSPFIWILFKQIRVYSIVLLKARDVETHTRVCTNLTPKTAFNTLKPLLRLSLENKLPNRLGNRSALIGNIEFLFPFFFFLRTQFLFYACSRIRKA